MDTTAIQTAAPIEVYTESTWDIHKHRVATAWRRAADNHAKKGKNTYEMLMTMDTEVREQHRELLNLKFDNVRMEDTSFSVLDW
jgi:hypothetical protein